MGIRRLDLMMPVKSMRDSGMSVRAIASATGLSPTTVLKMTHLWTDQDDGTVIANMAKGVDGRARLNRRVDTSERDDLIHRLRADGKSVRVIAEAVQCSVGTVHRILSS